MDHIKTIHYLTIEHGFIVIITYFQIITECESTPFNQTSNMFKGKIYLNCKRLINIKISIKK